MRQAFVLTAGVATRLRPLSYERAKAAVPVAGPALVERVVSRLVAAGIDDLVLNLHHRPETITGTLGDGRALGARVRYSWEPVILGSAGGPRLALDLIEEDSFVLVNGDTLTDLDLDGIVADHLASDALVTMALIPNPSPDWYGGVRVDETGAVVEFTLPGAAREPTYHFIGVQVARRSVFAGLPRGEAINSVGRLYPRLMEKRTGAVRAYVADARFHDVGTAEDYLSTCLTFAQSASAGALVSPDAHVDPTATVVDTVIWEGASVGPKATLSRCVVGAGAVVPAGAAFRECAIVLARGRSPEPGERLERDLIVAPLAGRRPRSRTDER